MIVRPTGTCFDDALDFLEELSKTGVSKKELIRDFVLVHGICMTPTVPSVQFAHAWVEWRQQLVFQRGIVDGQVLTYSMPLSQFEQRFNPVKTTRYTVAEAARRNAETNSYGPWEPEYAALTREGADRRVLGAVQADVAVYGREQPMRGAASAQEREGDSRD